MIRAPGFFSRFLFAAYSVMVWSRAVARSFRACTLAKSPRDSLHQRLQQFPYLHTYTGKAYARLHGWIYRADDPKGFWLEVAGSYLLGLALIALFLYENLFSN